MSLVSLLYAIGAAVVWGAVYTIDQLILASTPPIELLVINSGMALVALSPLLLFRRNPSTLGAISPALWGLMATSVTLAALANLLIFSGIKRLGAATASVFEIMYPLFVIVFSYAFLKSKPTFAFLTGAGLILVGSTIIIAAGI